MNAQISTADRRNRGVECSRLPGKDDHDDPPDYRIRIRRMFRSRAHTRFVFVHGRKRRSRGLGGRRKQNPRVTRTNRHPSPTKEQTQNE